MGEARKDALRLDFNRKLKLEFHGTKITSDAGLLAYRELDETLGLTSLVDSGLRDCHSCKWSTGSLPKSCEKRVLAVCARLFGGFSGTVYSTCWNHLETEMKLR